MATSPLKSVSPTKGEVKRDLEPANTLAQPYSPWKENIYLVENDRRALERDIRRTKNRMEGDLKAVLEQSRRGRETRQIMLEKEAQLETNVQALAERIEDDQRERETIDASREELKAKLAAIKVQVQSHVRELMDNLQEEKDTRTEIIDNYYDVASHLKEIKHGYFDLQKDLEPNPLGLSDRDQITKIRVQMEVMKELNNLDLSYASASTLPTPHSPHTALPASPRSPADQAGTTQALPSGQRMLPGQMEKQNMTRDVLRDMRGIFDSMDMSHHGVVDRRALAIQCHKNEKLGELFSSEGRKRDLGALCSDILPETATSETISWQEFVGVLGNSLQ